MYPLPSSEKSEMLSPIRRRVSSGFRLSRSRTSLGLRDLLSLAPAIAKLVAAFHAPFDMPCYRKYVVEYDNLIIPLRMNLKSHKSRMDIEIRSFEFFV